MKQHEIRVRVADVECITINALDQDISIPMCGRAVYVVVQPDNNSPLCKYDPDDSEVIRIDIGVEV